MTISSRPFDIFLRLFFRKIYLEQKESEFVSSQENRPTFQRIISEIFRSLNEEGECVIPVGEHLQLVFPPFYTRKTRGKLILRTDDANTIYLRIFPQLSEPPVVMEHHVPVIVDEIDSSMVRDWDLAIQQVSHVN